MGRDILKGNMFLDIDKAGLEAELVFTPDEGGKGWTEEDVFGLLARQGVIEGIRSEVIRSFFNNPMEAGDGSVRFPVAEGTPPELPSPVFYQWNDMPVPEELEKDAERILLSAPPPEITRRTIRKVKVRKKVVKKPKLSLGKPREEMVESIENREFHEPVDVNPEVLDWGWIKAGDALAEIIPPKPGKPGRNVFGKPIAPEASDKDFFLGRGILTKERVLLARYSGLFRRGNNWAEIIPFQHHEWKLSLSPDNATCLLDFFPGGTGVSVPDPAAILKEAEGLGVDLSTCISEEALLSELQEAIREEAPIEKMPLNTDIDGYFGIDVPEDKMTAKLVMVKGRGKGKPLVLKEVGRAIKTSGLKGLDLEKIKEDILSFYRSKDQELKDYILTEGTQPEGDGKVDVKCETAFLKEDEVEEIRSRLESQRREGLETPESLEVFPPSEITHMAPVQKEQAVAVLSIQKGENGKDVYGNSVPPGKGENPGYTLFENLTLHDNSVVSTVDGILDWAEKPEGVLMRCRPHRDAVIDIEVSDDGMSAYLSLAPPVGTGAPLDIDSVHAALEERKITAGIDEEAIRKACEAASAGEPEEKVLIASGSPPTHQGESRLAFDVEFSSGRGVSIRKDGRADYKNQDRITSVKKGTKIAHIMSPDIVPRDGWDIFGNTIKAQDAPPLNLQIGESIRQETDSEGTVTLYADRNGELMYDERSISVRNVHTVKGDVGPKTGNVKFSGTVEVTGSVTPGYAVFSGADVLIGENVEAGLVSADGAVRINQGVKGGGKAVLRAKKDVSATFLEQATVLAVEDVRIKNACLRCNIKTNGELVLLSEKGDLVGGVVRARKGVTAAHIGTEKGVRTHISFGQDYLIADRIELEEKEIHKLKEAIAKIDSSLRQYEKVNDRARLDYVRREKLKYLKMIEKRSIRLFNYREKFEEHFPSTVVVRDTVYPGVVFESHGRFKEITAPQKGLKVSFDPVLGQITLQSGNQKEE